MTMKSGASADDVEKWHLAKYLQFLWHRRTITNVQEEMQMEPFPDCSTQPDEEIVQSQEFNFFLLNSEEFKEYLLEEDNIQTHKHSDKNIYTTLTQTPIIQKHSMTCTLTDHFKTEQAAPQKRKNQTMKHLNNKKKKLDNRLLKYMDNTETFLLNKIQEETHDSFFKGTLSIGKHFSPKMKLKFKNRYMELLEEFQDT